MAVKILKNDDGTIGVSFIRGDTCILKFRIQDEQGTFMEKSDLDSLYLTCRKSNSKSSRIIFQKDIDDFYCEDEYYFITIQPIDTRGLSYGTYNFDIEATFSDGEVQTLKSEFTITDEDTIYKGG